MMMVFARANLIIYIARVTDDASCYEDNVGSLRGGLWGQSGRVVAEENSLYVICRDNEASHVGGGNALFLLKRCKDRSTSSNRQTKMEKLAVVRK